jgi:hypothetical protein
MKLNYNLLILTICAVWINQINKSEANDGRSIETNAQYHDEYVREWAIKVKDSLEADLIAEETGFVNRGPIYPFNNLYRFEKLDVKHRSKRAAVEHTNKLNEHEKVNYKQNLVLKN